MAVIRVLAFSLVIGLSKANADNNGHPFGIEPKQQTLWVNTVAETLSWKHRYFSLPDFINVIQQPYFHVITSGETPDVYYVFFRADPDILVFAYAFKNEDKSNGGFELHRKNEDQSEKLKLVDLLDTEVMTSIPGRPTDTRWQGYSLFGYAALIPPGYTGPLTLNFKLWNPSSDKIPLKGTSTFNWK